MGLHACYRDSCTFFIQFLLFVYDSRNGSVMGYDLLELWDDLVNNVLETMWKEAVTDVLELLCRHLRGVTEERHGKHQSGRPVCGLRHEAGTSRI
jgi:hypothetical protein